MSAKFEPSLHDHKEKWTWMYLSTHDHHSEEVHFCMNFKHKHTPCCTQSIQLTNTEKTLFLWYIMTVDQNSCPSTSQNQDVTI